MHEAIPIGNGFKWVSIEKKVHVKTGIKIMYHLLKCYSKIYN